MAVYCWNGMDVVTVVGAKNRPLGKIVDGFKHFNFHLIYDRCIELKLKNNTPKGLNFFVGDARYELITFA